MIRFKIERYFTYVEVDTEEELKAIKEKISYKDPTWEKRKWTLKYKPKWDGIKSVYDGRKNRFMTGLLPIVKNNLKIKGFAWKEVINIEPVEEPVISDFNLKGITYYDFQLDAIEKAIGAKRGVIKSPTGSGKTLIAGGLCKAFGRDTLFLVDNVTLMYQTKASWEKYLPELKSQMGVVGDGVFKPNKITFATIQTLYSGLKNKKKEVIDLLNRANVLIMDEAHDSIGESFVSVVCNCHNAEHRFAFTATPFMRDNPEEFFILTGLYGSIIFEISLGELIEMGILAQPYFKFVEVNDEEGFSNQLNNIFLEKQKKLKHEHEDVKIKYPEFYCAGITRNECRNEKILHYAKKMIEAKQKTIILVDKVEHGKNLLELFRNDGVNTQFISGKDETEVRQDALDKLGDGKIYCLIATRVFNKGIDVPSINAIINASGGKSMPTFFQQIGRSMRKKEDNKCYIIDFIDKVHKNLRDHSNARLKIVKNTKGFKLLS